MLLVGAQEQVAADRGQGRGWGVIKNGLFKARPYSWCPEKGREMDGDFDSDGDVQNMDMGSVDVPTMGNKTKKEERAFRTLKAAQFYCAADARQVCGLGTPGDAPSCPELVLDECSSCFVNQTATVDKACLCECEQAGSVELQKCFSKRPGKEYGKYIKDDDDNGDGKGGKGRRLRALDRDDKEEDEESVKFSTQAMESRSEVAGALVLLRTCISEKYDQISDICKSALHFRFKEEASDDNEPTRSDTTEAPTQAPEAPTRRLLADAPTKATVTGALTSAANTFDGVTSDTTTGGSDSNGALIAGVAVGAVAACVLVGVAVKKTMGSSSAQVNQADQLSAAN